VTAANPKFEEFSSNERAISPKGSLGRAIRASRFGQERTLKTYYLVWLLRDFLLAFRSNSDSRRSVGLKEYRSEAMNLLKQCWDYLKIVDFANLI